MTTLVLLGVLTAAAVPSWWRRLLPRDAVRDGWALGLVVLLVVTGVTAVAAGPAGSRWLEASVVATALAAAVAGGGPVTEAVLRRASRGPTPAIEPGDGSHVLRGGAWIGALERLGVCASVLAASPEGVAVVLAVKGLGRYPELRHAGASERFIIGTLASVLWAGACAAVAALAI